MFDGEKRDLQSKGIPKAESQTITTNSIGASGRTLRLTRAAVGFRFVGDIFDRYWTCHFIEYIPYTKSDDISSNGGIITTIDKLKLKFGKKPYPDSWRQRKVLELHFMLRILDQLVENTNKLRNFVRTELGVKETFVDITLLNSGDYFSSSTQWQQLHQVLQSVEDELDSVKANVTERWESRDDRGQEKPRWTTNDERKYRSIINTLEAKIGNRMRDMRRARDSVHSLKIWLEHMQDQTRNDLSLRGAENIRFFTYVTVVFLPLGFAVSIFSMADTEPGHHMLVNMVVCAVVALALTTIALVNAKTMAAVAEDMSYTISRRTRAAMRRSLLGRHYLGRKAGRRDGQPDEGGNKNSKNQGETPGSETKEELRPPRRPPLRSTVDQSWHLWFWLANFHSRHI
ncbi:hypothetical protein CMQ_487 [Grosmannia clavigera kw1407]|uniref:Mg2+ transporter zinc transport protein n=1 Tax=Grosmannia clavigera (strain kw1407 / UAMH 11150) TaxID=655863 RepID=F0XDT0_GROCL|nr:uncharacterized protein CMQ_487 [Grosmannia clavigera kw1407]EFX03559.1 hypothetical protein CMQ_487 [Grosmannia clavigera kw1407]